MLRYIAPLSIAAALVTAGAAHADQVVSEFTSFTSPSGNIGCMIDPSSVRCDIRQREWSPPPRPADCPSYTDYGQGIALEPGLSAQIVCAGDTAFGGGGPLAYGESITAGVLRCTSDETGMTCRDTGSGRGFFISRQGYRLF